MVISVEERHWKDDDNIGIWETSKGKGKDTRKGDIRDEDTKVVSDNSGGGGHEGLRV